MLPVTSPISRCASQQRHRREMKTEMSVKKLMKNEESGSMKAAKARWHSCTALAAP